MLNFYLCLNICRLGNLNENQLLGRL